MKWTECRKSKIVCFLSRKLPVTLQTNELNGPECVGGVGMWVTGSQDKPFRFVRSEQANSINLNCLFVLLVWHSHLNQNFLLYNEITFNDVPTSWCVLPFVRSAGSIQTGVWSRTKNNKPHQTWPKWEWIKPKLSWIFPRNFWNKYWAIFRHMGTSNVPGSFANCGTGFFKVDLNNWRSSTFAFLSVKACCPRRLWFCYH